MKQVFLRTLFLLLSVIALQEAFAQNPVQVNVFLTPPYAVKLSDYTAPGTSKLQAQLLLRDLTVPERQVRLRLVLSNGSATLSTRASFRPMPLYLQGGLPLFLTGDDLAPYLDPNNLDFGGSLTRQQYQRLGTLPEGFWTFNIQVIDYQRGNVISNTGTATAWLMYNEPPLLNLPANKSTARILDPQNIVFQWTPRHTASPNAVGNVEYEFTLVEIYPSGREPNNAMQAANPIYQTTTRQTTLIYGIAETPLSPGREYAWKVRAIDGSGLDLFRNHGNSEIWMFQYGETCSTPTGLTATTNQSNRIDLNWNQSEAHSSYTIQYRPQGWNKWYSTTSPINKLTLTNLDPETTYEIQVAATCGPFTSDLTNPRRVTTPERYEAEYTCGQPLPSIDKSNRNPATDLTIGSLIYAADFDVQLTSVWEQDGKFSGTGYTAVPLFNNARVNVTFQNVLINTDHRLVEGYLKVVNGTVQILNDDQLEQLATLREELNATLNTIDQNLNQLETLAGYLDDFLTGLSALDDPPDLFTAEERAYIESMSDEEKIAYAQTLIEEGSALLESDNARDRERGEKKLRQARAILNEAGQQEGNALIATRIDWANGANASHGFDATGAEAVQRWYEQIPIGDGLYQIPWKAVKTGQPEEVQATLQSETEGLSLADLQFTLEGRTLSIQQDQSAPTEGRLSVLSTVTEQKQQLKATHPQEGEEEQLLGILNVIAYDGLQKRLVLVPVNNNDAGLSQTAVQNTLNDIYGQAAVNWTVRVEESFAYPYESFNTGESGLLSNYSADMRALIRQYKQEKGSTIDEDSYYLFLLPEGGIQGYMPRAKQFGFLFTQGQGSEELTTTIAHELGHGAFHLQHIFTEYGIPEGSTDNLMDYAGGTRLHKYQWDHIHHPQTVIGFLEEDEEAAYDPIIVRCVDQGVLSTLGKTLFNRSDQPIVIPESVSPISFVARGEDAGEGQLVSFTHDGTIYVAYYAVDSKQFLGYAPKGLTKLSEVSEQQYSFSQGKRSNAQKVLLSKEGNICQGQILQEGRAPVSLREVACDCSQTGEEEQAGPLSFQFAEIHPLSAAQVAVFIDPQADIDMNQQLGDQNPLYDWAGVEAGAKERLMQSVDNEMGLILTGPATSEEILDRLKGFSPQDKNYHWTHIQELPGGEYVVKTYTFLSEQFKTTMLSQLCLEDMTAESLNQSLNLLWEGFQGGQYTIGEQLVSHVQLHLAVQKMIFSYLGEQLSQITFNRTYWDPSDPDFFIKDQYLRGMVDGMVPWALNHAVLYITEVDVRKYLGDKLIEFKDLILFPIFSKVAFVAGVWDGLISVEQILTGLAQGSMAFNCLAITLLVDQEYRREFFQQVETLRALITAENITLIKELLWSQIESAVVKEYESFVNNPAAYLYNNRYQAYYILGNIGFEVMLEALTAGTATGIKMAVSGALKSSRLMVKLITFLQRARPFLNYINRLIARGLLFIRMTADETIGFALRRGGEILIEITEDGLLHIRRTFGEGLVLLDELIFEPGYLLLPDGTVARQRSILQIGEEGLNILQATEADEALIKAAREIRDASGLDYATAKKVARFPAGKRTEIITLAKTLKERGFRQTDELLADLLDDGDDLLRALLDDMELADSWVFVKKHNKIRKHVATLKKISELLNDKDFVDNLPNGLDDLSGILNAVKNPLDNGTASKLVRLADHLENIKVLAKNHGNADGFTRLMSDLKNKTFAMQDGASHMLSDVKNYAKGTIKRFDYEFEGDGVVCVKCRFDVELVNGPPWLIEYKSWSLENIQNLSVKQMTEYFRSANGIEDIRYVFNIKKTPDLTLLKIQLQKVLLKNSEAIYDSMTDSLRENILGRGNKDRFDLFEESLENIESKLYNFIEIR